MTPLCKCAKLGKDILLSKLGDTAGVTGVRLVPPWTEGLDLILALLSSPVQHLPLPLMHWLLGTRSFSLHCLAQKGSGPHVSPCDHTNKCNRSSSIHHLLLGTSPSRLSQPTFISSLKPAEIHPHHDILCPVKQNVNTCSQHKENAVSLYRWFFVSS